MIAQDDVCKLVRRYDNIATTRIYDQRKMKPEDSPTFKVSVAHIRFQLGAIPHRTSRTLHYRVHLHEHVSSRL
jgi:hypothetical protein